MNPFKKVEEFEEEINLFLRKHKSFLSDQGKRISDYFEMSCYNKLVRYYENQGFEIRIQNLQANKFKYKLSPNGYPENFSYFEICWVIDKFAISQKEYVFEVHHNLTVQSGHQDDIYLTPDIAIINAKSIISDKEHYLVAKSSKKFCYVRNHDLQTFCEVKNFNPFPELLFNFIGLYNELKLVAINSAAHNQQPSHIAPSLFISGKVNDHTSRIKRSLEERYSINILCDLFERAYLPSLLRNKILSLKCDYNETTLEAVTDEEWPDLPF